MFVSVIANQIRTPVDWISASAIVLVTPAVDRVRWCGSCGRLAPFDTSISRAASTGDSRRNNRYVRVRFRARSCPRSLASSTDAAFPARHRTNHTALFERCSEAETSPSTLRTWPPDTPALSLPPPTQAFTRWPNTSATSARPSRVRARFIPSPRVARGPSSSSGEQRRK